MSQVQCIENIPRKMKAVVNYAPGDFRLEEVDVPEIGSEEVLLKVGGCGICRWSASLCKASSYSWT